MHACNSVRTGGHKKLAFVVKACRHCLHGIGNAKFLRARPPVPDGYGSILAGDQHARALRIKRSGLDELAGTEWTTQHLPCFGVSDVHLAVSSAHDEEASITAKLAV